MEKILILGLPGSGKTTLARPFSQLIGGVHLNADEIRARYDDWDFTLEGKIASSKTYAIFSRWSCDGRQDRPLQILFVRLKKLEKNLPQIM